MQSIRGGERATRSRYSSPFLPAPNNAGTEALNTIADAAAEQPRTSSENWVEPPLPAPRPSFADHGIERHGVVANMAPLGTRPSMKVMKAAIRPEGGSDAGRSAGGKRTGASVTPFEAMTPEPTTIPPRRTSISSKTDDFEQASPITPQQPSPQKSAQKTPVVDVSLGQGVFALSASPLPTTMTTNSYPSTAADVAADAMDATTDATDAASDGATEPDVTTPFAPDSNMDRPVFTPSTPATAFFPLPAQYSTPLRLGEDGHPLTDLAKTDVVVEEAVQMAIDNKRWPTAWALRELYDAVRTTDAKVVRIIEAVYNHRASPTQMAEFRRLMKVKKKEGKKDRRGEIYYDPVDPLPTSRFSTLNTALSYDNPLSRPGTGGRSASDIQARTASIPHLSTSPLKEYDIAHIAKKQKQSHFVSPYPPMPMNGLNGIYGSGASAAANAKPETPHLNGGSLTNSLIRGRSESESSSSSLSSVDEQIIDSAEFPSPARHRGGSSGVGRNNRSDNTSARYSAPTDALAPHSLNSQPPPISAPKQNGPKTFTFATVAAPSSSSFTSINHHNSRSAHSKSATNAEMAPIALVNPTSALGKPAKFISYKAKNLDKVRARAHDESDQATRLKRSAREITNTSTETLESFERYQPPPPAAPLIDVDTASEGDFVDVAPSRRPAKIRLLNKRTTRPRSNYDSEEFSSPTRLGFQLDIPPGSAPVSRAGTPSTLNRPTRKAKPGSGLRVKTS